jgi:hypothetical protein
LVIKTLNPKPMLSNISFMVDATMWEATMNDENHKWMGCWNSWIEKTKQLPEGCPLKHELKVLSPSCKIKAVSQIASGNTHRHTDTNTQKSDLVSSSNPSLKVKL